MIIEYTIKHIGPPPMKETYSDDAAFQKAWDEYQLKVRTWWSGGGALEFNKLLKNRLL